MGLVLAEKYRKLDGWLWKFYLNRYSRLMPSYLIVLALTSFMLSPQLFVLVYDSWQSVAFALSTLTLFGLELTAFYDISYTTGSHPAYAQLPIPQAWSLGIELVFYLLAPLLTLAATRTLVAAAIALLAARIFVAGLDPSGFPWLQRLWPLELYFFLLGILAYRFYAGSTLKDGPGHHLPECLLAFAAVIAIVMFAGYVEGMQAWQATHSLLVTLGLAIALPFIFALTGTMKVDRWIGEFSYPVYLVHILALNLVPQARDGPWSFMAVGILTAAPLVLFVEYPLERWRQRFFWPVRRAITPGNFEHCANVSGYAADCMSDKANRYADRILFISSCDHLPLINARGVGRVPCDSGVCILCHLIVAHESFSLVDVVIRLLWSYCSQLCSPVLFIAPAKIRFDAQC